ncbi:MAG TPA: ankyrin repeat domain-containing protein [Fimbriimonadaceae bacterium]|nr:ankyrin repeat domain-containing protein [Fimbriimonadaceae bacterium]
MSSTADRPDLRQLRIQAKELVRAVRAGDQGALSRVLPYFKSGEAFKLAQAQLVLARERGFESWGGLVRVLEPGRVSTAKPPSARLFEALEKGDDAAAIELIQSDPELAGVWRKGRWGWEYPLNVAAQHGRLEPAKALVEAGAEIYAVNQGDYPPVFNAFSDGHPEVGEFLLEASVRGDRGNLPPTFGCGIDIVLAARLGLLDRVMMQVERDPLAVYRRGCIGETVLHWPAHNGHVEVVRFLLDSGALIEADEIGLYGGKPLHWAAEHAPACVKLLLERGANPMSRNLMAGEFEGYTPLHMMARQPNQELECARRLLEAGADPAATDARGDTPLDVAKAKGRERVVEFLESRA